MPRWMKLGRRAGKSESGVTRYEEIGKISLCSRTYALYRISREYNALQSARATRKDALVPSASGRQLREEEKQPMQNSRKSKYKEVFHASFPPPPASMSY